MARTRAKAPSRVSSRTKRKRDIFSPSSPPPKAPTECLMEKLHKKAVPPTKQAANQKKAAVTLARGREKADERTLLADSAKKKKQLAAKASRLAAVERNKDRKSTAEFNAFLAQMQTKSGGKKKLQEKIKQLVAEDEARQLAERVARRAAEIEEENQTGWVPLDPDVAPDVDDDATIVVVADEEEEVTDEPEGEEEEEDNDDETEEDDDDETEGDDEEDEDNEEEDDPVQVAGRNFGPLDHMLGTLNCVSGVENGKVMVRGDRFFKTNTSLPEFVLGLDNAGKSAWLTTPPPLPAGPPTPDDENALLAIFANFSVIWRRTHKCYVTNDGVTTQKSVRPRFETLRLFAGCLLYYSRGSLG